MSGTRVLSESQLQRIALDLNLSSRGKKFLHALNFFGQKNSETEKALLLELLNHLRPQKQSSRHSLAADQLEAIASWEHTALLELVQRTDFVCTEANLAKCLGASFSPAEVHQALKRLERLGLLALNKNLTWARTKSTIATPVEFPSAAMRSFHSSMLDRAKLALETQAIHEREYQSLTLSISSELMPHLKHRIREFLDELESELGSTTKDATVHIQCQAFQLDETNPKTRAAVAKEERDLGASKIKTTTSKGEKK
jgi:uncharacterized protein (TIGR02147 family)